MVPKLRFLFASFGGVCRRADTKKPRVPPSYWGRVRRWGEIKLFSCAVVEDVSSGRRYQARVVGYKWMQSRQECSRVAHESRGGGTNTMKSCTAKYVTETTTRHAKTSMKNTTQGYCWRQRRLDDYYWRNWCRNWYERRGGPTFFLANESQAIVGHLTLWA